jgi:hypothetical protein
MPQWLGSLGAHSGTGRLLPRKLLAVEIFAFVAVLAWVLVAKDEAAKPAKARVITAARTKVFFMG